MKIERSTTTVITMDDKANGRTLRLVHRSERPNMLQLINRSGPSEVMGVELDIGTARALGHILLRFAQIGELHTDEELGVGTDEVHYANVTLKIPKRRSPA